MLIFLSFFSFLLKRVSLRLVTEGIQVRKFKNLLMSSYSLVRILPRLKFFLGLHDHINWLIFRKIKLFIGKRALSVTHNLLKSFCRYFLKCKLTFLRSTHLKGNTFLFSSYNNASRAFVWKAFCYANALSGEERLKVINYSS